METKLLVGRTSREAERVRDLLGLQDTYCCGLRASLTGRGFETIVVLTNGESESAAEQEANNRFLSEYLPTRLAGPSASIHFVR